MTREDVVKALRAHMQSKLDQVMPNSEGVNKKYIEEAYFTRKAKLEAILAKPMTTKPSSSIDDESIVFLHIETIDSNSKKWTDDRVICFFPGLDGVVGLFTCMGQTVFGRELGSDFRGKVVGDHIKDSYEAHMGYSIDEITTIVKII